MKQSVEIQSQSLCLIRKVGTIHPLKVDYLVWRVKISMSILFFLIGIIGVSQNNSLVLNGAYIILNGGTQTTNIVMVVDQSNTSGIIRPGGGHISSEGQYNLVKWNSGISTGNYVVPFGVGGVASDYIPLQFNKTSSVSSDLTASTYSTNNLNNPFPNPVTSMTQAINSIDRFWDIRSSSTVTADVNFSYRAIENTNNFCPTDTIKAQYWNNTTGPWAALIGPGNPGVTSGIGTVGPISNQTYFQNTETIWALTNPPINVNAGSNGTLSCAGSTYTLNGSSTASGVTYTWSGAGIVSGANTTSPLVNAAGNYTLTVVNPITGCAAQSTVNVANAPFLDASFIADQQTGFTPLSVNFTNNSTGAINYNWSFGNGSVSTSTNASTVYPNSGTYTIQLIATSGPCSDTAYATIVVNDGLTLEIPNVFTPNDDGINDVFTIKSTGVKEISMQIFNRWGQLMFSYDGAKAAWDGVSSSGNKASEGTYFYFVKASGFDNKEISKNGSMSLFR
jgi:gliding motility-associated-like protein